MSYSASAAIAWGVGKSPQHYQSSYWPLPQVQDAAASDKFQQATLTRLDRVQDSLVGLSNAVAALTATIQAIEHDKLNKPGAPIPRRREGFTSAANVVQFTWRETPGLPRAVS